MFSGLLNISSFPWTIIADAVPDPPEISPATDITMDEIFTYGSVALLAVIAAVAIIILIIHSKKPKNETESEKEETEQ